MQCSQTVTCNSKDVCIHILQEPLECMMHYALYLNNP